LQNFKPMRIKSIRFPFILLLVILFIEVTKTGYIHLVIRERNIEIKTKEIETWVSQFSSWENENHETFLQACFIRNQEDKGQNQFSDIDKLRVRILEAFESDDKFVFLRIQRDLDSYNKEIVKVAYDLLTKSTEAIASGNPELINQVKQEIRNQIDYPIIGSQSAMDSKLSWDKLYQQLPDNTIFSIVSVENIDSTILTSLPEREKIRYLRRNAVFYVNQSPFINHERIVTTSDIQKDGVDHTFLVSNWMNKDLGNYITDAYPDGKQLNFARTIQQDDENIFIIVSSLAFNYNEHIAKPNRYTNIFLALVFYIGLLIFLYSEYKKTGPYPDNIPTLSEDERWIPSWWGIVNATEHVYLAAFLLFAPILIPVFILGFWHFDYLYSQFNIPFYLFILIYFFFIQAASNEVIRCRKLFRLGTEVKCSLHTIDVLRQQGYAQVKKKAYLYIFKWKDEEYYIESRKKILPDNDLKMMVNPKNPLKSRLINSFY